MGKIRVNERAAALGLSMGAESEAEGILGRGPKNQKLELDTGLII